MAEVTCRRCKQVREGLARRPYNDELGQVILETVCATCWDDCKKMQVMVINENRLDLSDSRAQEMLERAIRDFLDLPDAEPAAPPATP
ncbi:MAG: Fe(2+)-trafficking protein [Gemmatimonadota bacterium]